MCLNDFASQMTLKIVLGYKNYSFFARSTSFAIGETGCSWNLPVSVNECIERLNMDIMYTASVL